MANYRKWYDIPLAPIVELEATERLVGLDTRAVETLLAIADYLAQPETWLPDPGTYELSEEQRRWVVDFADNVKDRLMTAIGCCPMRRDPATGHYLVSDDGGITFYEIPDGPWVENAPASAHSRPPARGEETADDRKCAAAANAAYVFHQTYIGVQKNLLESVVESDFERAGAIGFYLEGLAGLFGLIDLLPAVGIAVFLGLIAVANDFTENDMSDDDEERLKCILLENATDDGASVTFAWQAVWDAIDFDSPVNTLFRLLMSIMGADALNYAGGQIVVDDPACDCEAGEWCYTWDFTASASSEWSPRFSGSAEWDSGQGWGGGDSSEGMALALNTPPDMILTGWDTTTNSTETYAGYQNLYAEMGPPTEVQIWTLPGEANVPGLHVANFAPFTVTTDNWVNIQFNTYPDAPVHISRITLRGIGDNPFGTDNCE